MAEGAILVGDAGGTNVRFALARESGGRISLSDMWKRPGADYRTFDDAVGAYLSETKPKLLGASFGQLPGEQVELQICGIAMLVYWALAYRPSRAALRTRA